MTFEKRLEARAAEIEAGLAEVLDGAASPRAGLPPRLAGAMHHAVMAGGKRIRPFLVTETATALGAEAAAAQPAAIALELVHCYSLVHDDLPSMDNDTLRRGKPTVWKAFDEWTAILAGDALLTLAFEHLGGAPCPGLDDIKRLALVTGLALASGGRGMVGGQCLDLEADKLGQPKVPTAAHVRRLQSMKTGALFRFACEAGAIVAGASAEETAAMARFGAKLGEAFQLADDLLDIEGDAEMVGKATAKDAAAGKATLVGLEGIAAARTHLTGIERDALGEIAAFGARADVLRETLRFACARRK
jgi:farnesyl diphosphate synthase